MAIVLLGRICDSINIGIPGRRRKGGPARDCTRRLKSKEWILDDQAVEALPGLEILTEDSPSTHRLCGSHDQRIPKRQLKAFLKSDRIDDEHRVGHDHTP